MKRFLSPPAQKALVGLFFLLVLLVGLCTAGDYGRPWDESDEVSILRMNLWEYARAFGLDETIFERWAARDDDVLISVLTPISESVERDHGAAAFYPLAGVVLHPTLTGHSRMVLWHMGCWCLFTLGLFALYACCRTLALPRWSGLLAALCLLLSPRFFAEGHYNNKDVVLLSLSLCALWQGLRLMERPTFSRALLFALAGAFAANAKIIGLALWGLTGVFVLLRQLAQRKWSRRVAWVGLTALFSFAAFYALLTPAMWKGPAAFVQYLFQNAVAFDRWEGYVRFRGVTFFLGRERLPWYYLPYMMLVTTPAFIALLAAGGQMGAVAALCRNRRELAQRDDLLGLGLCSLLWLLPLGFALCTRPIVYNGWRHFYFLYGFLLILAAWGAATLHKRLESRPVLRRALCGLLILCLAGSAVGVIQWHPYQYAYYQPAVRLLTQEDDLELDYWNVSVMNIMTRLAAEREGTLRVSCADYWSECGLQRTLPVLEPFLRERIVVEASAGQADYVLCNPTYALYSGFALGKMWREAASVVSYGRTIMIVYERNASREAEP